MSESLLNQFESHKAISAEGADFLLSLENTIAQDLWESAGGTWSETSENIFRRMAMEKLSKHVRGARREDFEKAWIEIVREFHQDYWGEKRLLKKEKKEKTEEQKIFWELFSYILISFQALLITKTAVVYFGMSSAREGSTEGKIYLVIAILFLVLTLIIFAYRKSKKSPDS